MEASRETAGPNRRAARHRRRRRTTWIAAGVALLALVAASVAGWAIIRDGDGDDEVATRAVKPAAPVTTTEPAPTTTVPPTVPPTTTPPAPPGPPFALGITRTEVEDTTRGTMARGPTAASATRRIPLTIYYPTAGAATNALAENAPSAAGTFPLMIFAHGYSITAADYDPLIRDLAAGGWIVVAPDFPISSLVFPGPASQADLPNQAKDVTFLIDVLTNPATVPGVLQGHIAPVKVAIAGHSDGGVTAAAASGHSCCLDPRIGASAAYAGDQGGSLFKGEWFQPNASPQLFIHGTADGDVPYSYSQKLYADTVVTRMLVSIPGAVHWDPFVTGPQRASVVKLTHDFFRAHILGDAAATARLPADANEGGLRLEASE